MSAIDAAPQNAIARASSARMVSSTSYAPRSPSTPGPRGRAGPAAPRRRRGRARTERRYRNRSRRRRRPRRGRRPRRRRRGARSPWRRSCRGSGRHDSRRRPRPRRRRHRSGRRRRAARPFTTSGRPLHSASCTTSSIVTDASNSSTISATLSETGADPRTPRPYGTAAPSTDATIARYPAAAACSARARVRPRSCNTYIWANLGAPGAAAAIASSEQYAAIDVTMMVCARAAARAVAHSASSQTS